jgi:transposase
MVRRNFTAEFKAKVVLEILSGTKSAAQICREHDLKPDLLSHWKSQFLADAAKVFENAKDIDPQQERIEELERLAGKLSAVSALWLPTCHSRVEAEKMAGEPQAYRPIDG